MNPQMLMNNRANYFANALQQGNVDPRLLQQAQQFAAMQNQMQQRGKPGPMGGDFTRRMELMAPQMQVAQMMRQRQTPGFYTPDWNAIFGPSLDRYQQQAHQSQQQAQNGVGGGNGPVRRGLGNLFGGNLMESWRRGYQARRGMGGLIPGL